MDVGKELESLLSQHGAKMRYLALRYLHDRSRADDAVQEAALRFLVHGRKIRDRGKILQWFRSTLVNFCRHEIRDRRGEESMPKEDGIPAISKDPSGMSVLTETDRRLRRAIAELTHMQRGTVILFAVDRFTSNETALALGIRNGAARALLCRARQALSKALRRSA